MSDVTLENITIDNTIEVVDSSINIDVQSIDNNIDIFIDKSPNEPSVNIELLNDEISVDINLEPIEISIDISFGGPGGGSDEECQPYSGGVYLVNVSPLDSGNVSNFTYLDGNKTISSFLSSSSFVRLRIISISGHSFYKPVVKLNDTQLSVTETSPFSAVFESYYDLNIATTNSFTLSHNDGPEYTVNIIKEDLPNIVSAQITSGYPGSQTELKYGDQITVSITTDVNINFIEIENFGAVTASSFAVAVGKTHTFNLSAANRGNTPIESFIKLRVRSLTGTNSNWKTTSNSVVLNNLKPTISIQNVVYPVGQLAIKNAEIATLNHTISNFTSVVYSSSVHNIENPTTYTTAKNITIKNNTAYSVTQNLTITATRTENGSVTVTNTTVKISNVAPTISISNQINRLRSGGNLDSVVQSHQFVITSSQQLFEAPIISTDVANLSNCTGANTVWYISLLVHDDDPKISSNLTLVQAKSLSGITTGVFTGGNFTIGGFVRRTFNIGAFPARSNTFGTIVLNTAKLKCSNLSKGESGSFNFTYQPTQDDGVNKYTIIGNDMWYNCDTPNSVSNTTGLMRIELEELA